MELIISLGIVAGVLIGVPVAIAGLLLHIFKFK